MPSITPEPIEIKITYQPMPKQAEFHSHNAQYRLFAGGFGNGKTSAGCAEGLALALEYPGCTGLIARKTRPELKATTMETFFKGGGGNPATDFTGIPQELIRSFNKTEMKLTLINNSIIHFWPLDEPQKLTNINLGWFLIDQAEEVDEDMFMMLIGRLRQINAPRKGLVLCNPSGHDWIWRRWVYLKYPNHGMVHAKTTDNPNLPPDYIETLMAYPEAWRKRFMEGSWDVFTGQIWPEFDPDVHTIRPTPIESWWEFVEGIDHGRRNPTAVLWAAFFEDYGTEYCFVVEEHYEAGKRVSHHADRVHEIRKELMVQPIYTVIDASAAQKDPNTERSVIDEYWDKGIHTIPSDRHKTARINRVAEWLRLDPGVAHPITGERSTEGYPRLYVFKTCTELAEHIPGYRWKPQPPNKSEDGPEEAQKKDDHDVDALGYILMTRPPPGTRPIRDISSGDARTEAYWARHRDRIGAGQGHAMLGTEG
jgi:phage terminase large subunit